VPYTVRGGERFFARPEVRMAMTTLARLAPESAAPTGGTAAVEASPNGGAGAAATRGGGAAAAASRLVPDVRAALEPLGLTASPPAPGALRDRWDALAALVSVAEELAAADPDAGMTAFVAELRARADAQHAPAVDGVTLASLHAAKGLEWDAVFLVGLTDGTLPIQHADTPEAIEEERRLLYVGITRARRHLALSWALARNSGGRQTRRRSRFLTGVAPEPERTAGRGRRAGRCRICGGPLTTPAEIKTARCGNCPSNADPALVEELKTWRKTRAKEASVPAFVVFSDATLLAIAERRPADDAALLAIPGIGRSKLDRFGADVLAIVARC
jgi:DNA helicase-2/ATP-dependent DNA helicase PcrA